MSSGDEEIFIQIRYTMVNKHMKNCSLSNYRYKSRPQWISLHSLCDGYYNKTDNKKWWQRCGEIWIPIYCLLECKMGQMLWKTICQFLKWLNIELLYNLAIHF